MAGRAYKSLDFGVAAVAAAAFGFVVYAMPGSLFEDLVIRSGLPDVLSAAQPPLGMKARAAVVGLAALIGFATIFALLRAVDRVPAKQARKPAAPVDEDAPRVRRADAHPDAPSRRPLLAGRELGEPVEAFNDFEPEPVDDVFADLPAAPLPAFLAAERADDEAEAEGDVEEEQPFVLDQRADEPGFDEADEEGADEDSIDEGAFASLFSQLPRHSEESGDESITDLMRRLESGLSQREEAAEADDLAPAAAEEIAQAPATPSWLAPQPQSFEAEAEPVLERAATAQPPVDEFGELRWPSRGDSHEPVAADPAPEPAAEDLPFDPPQPPEPAPQEEQRVGHRLRSALGEMQKIAARGG
jgi:hypothetical protein